MNDSELKEIIKKYRDRGLNDKQIKWIIYDLYKDRKIDLDEFITLARIIGYELKESFICKERIKFPIN